MRVSSAAARKPSRAYLSGDELTQIVNKLLAQGAFRLVVALSSELAEQNVKATLLDRYPRHLLGAIPFSLPTIHSYGIGGSSVVRVVDAAIRIGPESVGASPGPACFARGGTEATLTATHCSWQAFSMPNTTSEVNSCSTANVPARPSCARWVSRYEFTYSPDPKWCRIIEFYCPECGTMMENEYLPPGHPLTNDIELDIDKLKARHLHGEGASDATG